MFGTKYCESCSECGIEWIFRSKKTLRGFMLGSNHRCPKCGNHLSCVPLCPYILTPPPDMREEPRMILQIDAEKEFNER